MYLDALFPGVTLDEVKALNPWDLKVADPLSECPKATDAETLALRKFAPSSSFTKPVATELSGAHLQKTIAEREARLKQCKSPELSAN